MNCGTQVIYFLYFEKKACKIFNVIQVRKGTQDICDFSILVVTFLFGLKTKSRERLWEKFILHFRFIFTRYIVPFLLRRFYGVYIYASHSIYLYFLLTQNSFLVLEKIHFCLLTLLFYQNYSMLFFPLFLFTWDFSWLMMSYKYLNFNLSRPENFVIPSVLVRCMSYIHAMLSCAHT